MRRTKDEAERTRKRLMDAGVRVFGSKGYAAARLSCIAAEAGVTRGAVYWHFGSKKGLMFAILREIVSPYRQIIEEVLESELDPDRKIRELIRRMMNAMDKSKAFVSHEQLATRFKAEHPDAFDEYHGDISGGMRRVDEMLRRAVRDGQKAGRIRSDVGAGIIAGTVVVVLRGYGMMKTDGYPNLLPRGTSGAVVELIMKGLEPR